jgi:FdhE protein
MRTVDRKGRSAWSATAVGEGIRVPDPIMLPDPATLFARRATRLDYLAQGHPMADWLQFMATLARAQQAVLSQLPAPMPPDPEWVGRALAAGRPPLAAVDHPRRPIWREGLSLLLDAADDPALPEATRRVTKKLRAVDPDALEVLADRCLQGRVAEDESGEALYITAALQVYFVGGAACMDAISLRMLERRGQCPVCGYLPVSSMVTASGRAPGTRFLHCSLCATAWNHTRAICTVCGGSRSLTLQEIEGSDGSVKAETCGECMSYVKVLYEAKQPQLDPVADDLATLGLDMLVSEGGWSRHPPLLLAGVHN